MELDDLKQSWQQPTNFTKPLNSNIMELIQNKNYGPLAVLNWKFKKQLLGIPVIIGLLIYQVCVSPHLFESPAIWILYSLAFVLGAYFALNYYIVSRLQKSGEAVKQNVEMQLNKIESNFKWYRIAATVYYMLIPVAIELALYFHIEKDFEQWGDVNIFLRIAAYAAGIVCMTFLSKRWFKKQYGDHLQNLKQLIKQMD